jgi:VPDSG-CTERM motif
MKALKYTILVAALASGFTLTAKADLILSPFGDIPKNGTGIGGGNSNNQANNFFRLQNYIAAHPTFGSLGTPTLDGAVRLESNLNQPIDLTGFCYAVVHYGAGQGGTPGGGIAFFQITGPDFIDTFPQSGSGPNGFGGISSVDLFACIPQGVPDGGATVMLLGAALGALGIARRFIMS